MPHIMQNRWGFPWAGSSADHDMGHLFPYTDVTLKGEEINVYATDYTDEVALTLSGMWHVYSDDRFFAIVKWSD